MARNTESVIDSANPARHFLIREAVWADIAAFDAMDEAAGAQFPAGRLPPSENITPAEDYAKAIELGWLTAVDVGNRVVGYSWCVEFDRVLHLRQITVHPDQSRRGIGRTLLARVIVNAGTRGVTEITLTTFADIVWNAPFYRGSGFHEITDPTRYPHVASALELERTAGLTKRIGRVRVIGAGGPS